MGPERHAFPLQQAKVKLKGMFHFLLKRVTSFLEGGEDHTGLCSQATCSGKIPWSRKWQPTLIFLPGKFHRQRSLVGYSLWGRKESDMTE